MSGIRQIWREYKEEFFFAAGLIGCVMLSFGLAPFIPFTFYINALSPILNGCIAATSIFGAIILFRHYDGVHVRLLWASVLLVWAVLMALLLMHVMAYNVPLEEEAGFSLRGRELILGNIYAWLLLHYPTAVLRPGWLNMKRVLIPLIPVAVIAVVDELFSIDLRWLLAIYPVWLGIMLLTYHVRGYRVWCEENYSSMDNIDVQWIWRYMTMYFIAGGCYLCMCLEYNVSHALTMQWFLLFMLVYSTEQILYRQDPWNMIRKARHNMLQLQAVAVEEEEDETAALELSNPEYRAQLEQWMETEKPYLNPEFRLMDLRQILPMNRTYLSQLIHIQYDCNFYQFVTKYRIEEAQRLMTAHPDMKVQDVAEQSGFSSPVVFSRVFTREVGTTPKEWLENVTLRSKCDNT